MFIAHAIESASLIWRVIYEILQRDFVANLLLLNVKPSVKTFITVLLYGRPRVYSLFRIYTNLVIKLLRDILFPLEFNLAASIFSNINYIIFQLF